MFTYFNFTCQYAYANLVYAYDILKHSLFLNWKIYAITT